MGTWGSGLWSDDTASDVRATYREALEDGLSDTEAREKVLTDFSSDLHDNEAAPVVWLAFAAVQSDLGRLEDDVRDRAIDVIDTGADLERFADDPPLRAKRKAVLDRLRTQLISEQPGRKNVRRRSRPTTTLTPGDVLGYRGPSGRLYLLAVRHLNESRQGSFPVVRLLEFQDSEPPPPKKLARLKERRPGAPAQGSRPAEPWWAVEGIVMHKRGHDFADAGFAVVAHVDTLARLPAGEPDPYTNWTFWREYLDIEDELLTERQAQRSSRRSRG